MKTLLGLSLTLTLSACFNAKSKTFVDMEFSPAEDGLRLSIRFSKPVDTYTFFGDLMGANAPNWSLLTEELDLSGFSLTHPDGHKFVKANILIKPDANFNLSSMFVVTNVGAKGFLIIPDMFEDTDPDTTARITFKPQDDFIALQNRGERLNGAPYIRKAVLPLGMPFVYYGPRAQVNDSLSRIVSDENPEWLDVEIEKAEDKAWAFYEDLFDDYPVPRPLSVVTGFPEDAPYSYLGLTTIKGVIGYWLDLEKFEKETLKERRDVQHLAAHETAHLWVGAAFRPTEPVLKRWLFEGLADYLAWKYVADGNRAMFLRGSEEALNNCMDELGTSNMNTVIPSNFTQIYECGLTVQVLLDAGEYQSSGGARDGLDLWSDIFEDASGLRVLLDWQDYQVLMSNSAIGNDRGSAFSAIFSRQHRLSWKHVLTQLDARPNADDTKEALKLFITQTGKTRWTKLPDVLAPLGITADMDILDIKSREAILKRYQNFLRVDDCEGAPDHMSFADNQVTYHWIPMGDDCPASLGPIDSFDGTKISAAPKKLLRELKTSCEAGDDYSIDITFAAAGDAASGSPDDTGDTGESGGDMGHVHCADTRAFRRYSAKLSYQ